MKFRLFLLGLLCGVTLGATLVREGTATRRSAGPMPQDVYVWQRAWTEPVRAAIGRHATNFAQIVALAGEVNWRSGRPEFIRVAMDYPALHESARSIGIALQIGSYPGPFSERTPMLWRF